MAFRNLRDRPRTKALLGSLRCQSNLVKSSFFQRTKFSRPRSSTCPQLKPWVSKAREPRTSCPMWRKSTKTIRESKRRKSSRNRKRKSSSPERKKSQLRRQQAPNLKVRSKTIHLLRRVIWDSRNSPQTSLITLRRWRLLKARRESS